MRHTARPTSWAATWPTRPRWAAARLFVSGFRVVYSDSCQSWLRVRPAVVVELLAGGQDVGTFSQEEAEAKIGTFVKTLIPFGGLPRGTRGTVTRALCLPDGYAIIVRWQWPRPRAMWFDKEVYQYALVEAANQTDC